MTMTNDEIKDIKHEDRILAHLEEKDLEPAGFERIKRTRPVTRPSRSERDYTPTRRPREGKW